VAAVAGLMAAGGFLLAAPGSGCSSFTADSLLVSTDFCFIFDCQGGILGGTVNPCSGVGSGDQTIEGDQSLPLFTDCPNNP
jgi:hypothetical protein